MPSSNSALQKKGIWNCFYLVLMPNNFQGLTPASQGVVRLSHSGTHNIKLHVSTWRVHDLPGMLLHLFLVVLVCF